VNTATQELIVNPKGQEKIRRRAICPLHNQATVDYVAPNVHGWLFRCKETDEHEWHYFAAKVPKDVPTDTEGVKAWLETHRRARISDKGVRKRGA
jgi:hypothetical protein